MKYLLPLLFLVGCESFPEKKEGPQLIEDMPPTIPLGETWIDDMIDDSIKVGPIDIVVADDDGRIHTVPIICGTGVVQGECGVITCECICHY